MVWRGGRRFSPPKTPTPNGNKSKKTNGGNDDAVMIIDSDEENTPEPPKEETTVYEFEPEETEVDPAYPFEEILRQIDIPLGSKVLDLAVPRILPEAARSALDPFPPVLKDTIVIAAVCADFSTRIVTLPLKPPHLVQTDPSTWGIQTISIAGGVSHQEIPRGVSITFTCQEVDNNGETAERWDLLVATHSAEASGLLLIHRIAIWEESNRGQVVYRLSDEDIESRRRYLPAPAQTIAFNPSGYPSTRHSTLLVVFHSGCVKIYSCFSTKPSKASRRSGPQSDYETTETEGRWLISLFPGFETAPSGLPRRKTVIDADWVLGGRAVMVLMADGEWGVWDIEGAGPGTAKGPLQRQSSVQGVTGGSLSTFSVSGQILSPLPSTKNEIGETNVEQRPKFAPLTPATKRVREDTLLKGSLGSSTSPSMCGEVSVFQTNSARDALPDESILLRHGNQSAVIPSLLSLWRNAVKAAGTFDSSNRCRVTTIQDVHLMGEHFTGIGHLPAASRQTRNTTDRREFDILVTAEHRVMILAPRLVEPQGELSRPEEPVTTETDQLMLHRGELDVDGMDRVLSGMASGNRSLRMGSPIKRARVFT